MKNTLSAVLLLGAGAALGSGGYWLANQRAELIPKMTALAAIEAAQTSEKKVLYYREPMGKADYSPTPRKDSMGMDYLPVYEGDEETASVPTQAAAPPADNGQVAASPGKGKIRFYRNPMGLPDTSPVPKKDGMGMDYLPVYEGEGADDGDTVKISVAKVQKLGLRSEPAEMRDLARAVRAVGTVQPDERRLFVVNTKFEGWIDKLHANATGESVRRGEPLMEIYAPELVVAQQEYLLAWRSLHDMANAGEDVRTSAKQLAEASLQRLRNWDISDDQIKLLQRSGKITRTLTLRAPASGVVMEKTAIEGMRFMAGDPLYRIADLSTVWVSAELYEQDLGTMRVGQEAKVTVNAYPGEALVGKVDFIYPTVSQETRTGKVRIVIGNPDARLKTGMYANVVLAASLGGGPVLTVQDSAVIDSGTRQIFLVERREGSFEPREVKLGAHADGFYEIRDGLAANENVVVSANFLIDAESNLKAALKAFTTPDADGTGQPKTAPTVATPKS